MTEDEAPEKHAVKVYLRLSDTGMGTREEFDAIQELEDELEGAINRAGVGEFDGDEFGEGECILFMYGPNADALFDAVKPVLRRSPFAVGGHVIKRYGEPGAEEARILI